MTNMVAISEMVKMGEPHGPTIALMKKRLEEIGINPRDMTIIKEQRFDMADSPFHITVTGKRPDEEISEKEADEIS
jgi:hypothetical protein